MRQGRVRNDSYYRDQLIRWKSKSVQNQNKSVQPLNELENLQIQVNQVKEQVNFISTILAQFDSRAVAGLNSFGIMLHYGFAPFRRIKRLLKRRSFWEWFYWICFAWVYARDAGIKGVLFNSRRDIIDSQEA